MLGGREGVLFSSALASALAILVTASALWQGAQVDGETAGLVAPGRTAEAMLQVGEHVKLLRAVQVEPSNPEAWFRLSVSYEVRKEWRTGLEAAQQANRLNPAEARYADKKARLAGLLMLDELAAGRRQEALGIAKLLQELEKGWTGGRLDPATLMRFAQARFLLGDLAGAKQPLLDAAKVGLLNSEAEVWLYALYEKQGETPGMKRLENQPWIRFRESNPVYQAIRR